MNFFVKSPEKQNTITAFGENFVKLYLYDPPINSIPKEQTSVSYTFTNQIIGLIT